MPSKQKLIGNIAFELCDTEAPGLKYDKTFGGMQKYIQHQRYSHHVMKEYDPDKQVVKRTWTRFYHGHYTIYRRSLTESRYGSR